jgi:hypothetical protein
MRQLDMERNIAAQNNNFEGFFYGYVNYIKLRGEFILIQRGSCTAKNNK